MFIDIILGANRSISRTCNLQGTTFASCSFTDALDISGSVYPAGLNSTYNGTTIVFAPVTVTGGIEKLSGLTNATCTAASTFTPGATSTSKSRSIAAGNGTPPVAMILLSGVVMLIAEAFVREGLC